MHDKSDTYSRVDYRRMVAWPQRIERERPVLEELFGHAPAPRLLDLGCGTGEHARFLASRGFAVVGIDASEAMLAQAREEGGDRVDYIAGDIADVGELTEGAFGGAICLGNTLPHLTSDEALARFASGLRGRLLPGAPFLLQILNYEKILGSRQRFLPLNFKEDAEGEMVFLRLMDPRPDGTVVFTPTTLRYRPSGDPPVAVVASRNVSLRGWTRSRLEEVLEHAGFRDRTAYGGIPLTPYTADGSNDLVIVAR